MLLMANVEKNGKRGGSLSTLSSHILQEKIGETVSPFVTLEKAAWLKQAYAQH